MPSLVRQHSIDGVATALFFRKNLAFFNLCNNIIDEDEAFAVCFFYGVLIRQVHMPFIDKALSVSIRSQRSPSSQPHPAPDRQWIPF